MAGPHKHVGPDAGSARPSAVRLVVLLAILAIAIGAFCYDYFVAKPGVEKANFELELAATKNNEMGIDLKADPETQRKQALESIFDEKDVQDVLKMKPTDVERGQGYTIETYRWWGNVPVLNRRHYMTVVYYGGENQKLRYSTHFVNQRPPAESLPGGHRVENFKLQNIGASGPPEGITMPSGSGLGGKKGGKGGMGGMMKGFGPPGDKGARPPSEGGEPPPAEEAGKERDAAGEKGADSKSDPTKEEAKPSAEKDNTPPATEPEAKSEGQTPPTKDGSKAPPKPDGSESTSDKS
jgi:hypothetical protein